MRIAAAASRASILVVSALSLAACSETTAPPDISEVRLAHAAPGLGSQVVLIEGETMVELAPFQSIFFPLDSRPLTYAFAAGGDTVTHHVAQHDEISAVVLMNPDQPEIYHFPLTRRLFQVRLMVINGDFSTAEPLTVRIEQDEFEFEEAIGPGEHAIIDPDAGTFNLSARAAGADGFVTIQPFSVVPGDNGFLIVLPDPDPDAEIDYIRMLF